MMLTAPIHGMMRSLLLGFTLLTVALPTVVTYRGGLQPDYEWGLFGLHGTGTGGPWWLIALIAACGWLTLTLNHRLPGKTATGLLALWHVGLFLNVLSYALRHGAEMNLRGDAVGFSLNLAWIGPGLTGICLAASLWMLAVAWRIPPPPLAPLGRIARVGVIIGVALGPVIAILFLRGDGVHHTGYDRWAIAGVVAQCLLVGGSLQERAGHQPPS